MTPLSFTPLHSAINSLINTMAYENYLRHLKKINLCPGSWRNRYSFYPHWFILHYINKVTYVEYLKLSHVNTMSGMLVTAAFTFLVVIIIRQLIKFIKLKNAFRGFPEPLKEKHWLLGHLPVVSKICYIIYYSIYLISFNFLFIWFDLIFLSLFQFL